MAFTTSGSRGANADINVTPLVDVVLVLLIIFMVVTPLLQLDLPADIPRQAESPPPRAEPPKQLVVVVQPDGSVRVAGEAVDDVALASRISRALAERSDTSVFLAADPGLQVERVVHVMVLCRRAGATQVG